MTKLMLLLKDTNTTIYGNRSWTNVFVNKIININKKGTPDKTNKTHTRKDVYNIVLY